MLHPPWQGYNRYNSSQDAASILCCIILSVHFFESFLLSLQQKAWALERAAWMLIVLLCDIPPCEEPSKYRQYLNFHTPLPVTPRGWFCCDPQQGVYVSSFVLLFYLCLLLHALLLTYSMCYWALQLFFHSFSPFLTHLAWPLVHWDAPSIPVWWEVGICCLWKPCKLGTVVPGYVAPVPLQSLLVQESNFWPAFLQEEQNSQLIFCLQADFPKIIERGRV